MILTVKPNKLDGVLNLNGFIADYVLASNCFGNRVRVIGGSESVSKLLLEFNAKGTKFNLADKEWLTPIISVCALFAFSNTEISGVEDYKHTVSLINALNGIGGSVEYNGDKINVKGVAGIKGGTVNVCRSDILLAVILAGTCAENETVINYTGSEKVDEIVKTVKSVGGIIEIK